MAFGISFGESLTEILERRKISIDRFIKDINISSFTFYAWRRNEQDIKLSRLNRIANYFHCSIEYIVNRHDNDWFVEDIELPNFGKRLREVMKECEITTYYLRKNYGYSSRHFRSWDDGGDPYLCTLVDLARILDCTIDYLVGRIWLKDQR